MVSARWSKVAGAILVTTALSITGGMAWANSKPIGSGFDQSQLQRGLNTIRDAGAPGVIAEVHIGNSVLRGTSGVADLTTGRRVPVEGYFRMGSNTKTFVAVVILQLAAEHRLSLDDTVDRWLPGVVSGNGNDGRTITIRQLLNHTAGIFDFDEDILAMVPTAEAFNQHRFDTFTLSDLVAMAMRHPPYFAPGTSWHYSNTDYTLAAMIIKKATGRDWATEVTDRVLRPLGLRHTFNPGQRAELPEPHANGYMYQYDPDHPLDVTTMNMTWADADGSLITTTADLSRFWRAIGRGTLLSRAQRAEMQTTVATVGEFPNTRYGLGLYWTPLTCGGGYWSHPGGVPGFTTMNGVSDNGRKTVVLSMSATTPVSTMEIANRMIDDVMCSRS